MRGSLFIISAPSGTGKTTILKRILETVPGVVFSVSHTTRSPRPGERDGIDYHFVDQQAFTGKRDEQDFLEWAEVHGNLYGTCRDVVEESLARGQDVILDIDVQGASQIKKIIGNHAVFVFIAPPSWEELERRLSKRGTDSPESVKIRCDNARNEMADIGMYDHVIVNDEVDDAVQALQAVILAERSRNRRLTSGEPFQLFLNCETNGGCSK